MSVRKYENMTASEIISHLEEKYKDDEEALELIARAKQNIAYIKSNVDYKGQTPWQHAAELAGNLEQWY